MECPRCHFQNMPGLAACFRCGSVLAAPPAAINVHPPRAPAFVKPFRSLRRTLRLYLGYEKLENADQWAQRAAAAAARGIRVTVNAIVDSFLAVVFSVIPGLPQLIEGEFRKVRHYCLIWLILILGGCFFYGSSLGLFLVGLAVGLHAWLTLAAFRMMASWNAPAERVAALAAAIVCLGLLYWFIGGRIGRMFPGSYIPFDVSYYRVHQGDYLLGRRIVANGRNLPRGALVLADSTGMANHGWVDTVETVGEVLGLPGETVSIGPEAFAVGGKRLDKRLYPMQGWMTAMRTTLEVPVGYYFLNMKYQMNAPNLNEATFQNLLRTGCLIRFDQIHGRLTVRWLPLTNRGFLKEVP